MKAHTAALLLSVTACATPAVAQVTPWYVGIAAGVSRTSEDLVANRESTLTHVATIQTDFDDGDHAVKLTGGYRIFPWLAVEVDYTDLGSHRLVTNATGGDPILPARLTLDRDINGYGVDAVFTWPVAPRWKLLGRVGAFHARIKATQQLEGNIVFTNGDPSERSRTAKQSETVLRFGAGVQWELNDCSALRLEWARHDDIGKAFQVGGSGTTGEAATDSVTFGYYFRF